MDLHLPLGGDFILGLFFVYSTADFEVPWQGRGGEKSGGIGGSPPHKVHGGQPGALLALLTAGNRCNPYLDTVGNGSGPGKSGTYDPQLDPKARNLTPNF